MTDTLSTRVTRIITGSAHAFLDVVEDLAPEAMLRQATRELDQVMSDVRVDLGKVEAAKHLLTSQVTRLNTENETLADSIEAALTSGNDDLARAGVERQVLIEDQLPVLQHSLAEQGERGKELEGYITALVAKRREMEDALKTYLASKAQAGTGATGAGKASHDSRVEQSQTAFDRVMARQTGVTGTVGTDLGDAQKLKELADLARSNRVAERLATIKAKLGK
jgi:phage shock protein A